MSQTTELIEHWRANGPQEWASGPFGWLDMNGEPIALLEWQRAVLGAWWARRSDVSTLAISNVKKTGKTTLNALLTCWRWLTLPGRHFAVGNDLDQSASLVFAMVSEMAAKHPYLSRNCKITVNRLTFIPTGSTLEALATDASGNAGANFLTASHTEAWGIVQEGSIRSYEELTPPPGTLYGFPALRIVDSYAGYLDESVTWHGIVDRGLAGKQVNKAWGLYQAEGLLLFHAAGLEAQERCFRGSPLERARYYKEQQATLRVNAFTRLHLNERSTNESKFVSPEEWGACYDPLLRAWGPEDTRSLVLGADASTSRDLTALIGCCYDNGRVQAVYSKVWKPTRSLLRGGKPTVDLEQTIGEEVLDLHRAGRVSAVVADPYQLHVLIIKWQKAGIKVIELAQNAGRVESDQGLYDAILSRSLAHVNHKDLNEAIQNAVAIETPRGLRLAKEKAAKKIDAAVALSMAHWGALQRFAALGKLTSMPNIFMNPDALAEWMAGQEAETHEKISLGKTLMSSDGVFREHAGKWEPSYPGESQESFVQRVQLRGME